MYPTVQTARNYKLLFIFNILKSSFSYKHKMRPTRRTNSSSFKFVKQIKCFVGITKGKTFSSLHFVHDKASV